MISGSERHEIGAVPIERLVDTTGAGDVYAAGFLYGLPAATTWRCAASSVRSARRR